jgi:hypothetical protein
LHLAHKSSYPHLYSRYKCMTISNALHYIPLLKNLYHGDYCICKFVALINLSFILEIKDKSTFSLSNAQYKLSPLRMPCYSISTLTTLERRETGDGRACSSGYQQQRLTQTFKKSTRLFCRAQRRKGVVE